jgi:hypothetical protein
VNGELTTAEIRRIDEAVESAGQKAVRRLFPSLIAEETKTSLKKVVKRLLELAAEGRILATYEFDCPNCDRTVEKSDSLMERARTNRCGLLSD